MKYERLEQGLIHLTLVVAIVAIVVVATCAQEFFGSYAVVATPIVSLVLVFGCIYTWKLVERWFKRIRAREPS